jgi:hypothetical protein
MKVCCHTNLDLQNEVWPVELPCLPAVGHTIVSRTRHAVRRHSQFQLELQVVSIKWEFSNITNEWLPVIKLHMTEWQKHLPGEGEGVQDGSITAFYQWYAPAVGKSVGSFI